MQSLGKYQLVAEIARGGMGIVYLAVSSGPAGFSKLFVIKELKPELVVNGDFYDMFLEEARLAARLSHPNIVTTYEVGADGQRPFIVMDYLEGESLARIVRQKSPQFTLAMHLRVLCSVLDALEHAHHLTNFDESTSSIVHRDVSPQNVFVTFDGQVKLVDFGIAKASDTVLETQAGTFKGKPGYMAPEQLGGDVDPRADLFSVGVMLWEACADARMFRKMTQLEILTALIKGDIPRLASVKPDAPAALQAICDRATAKNADDRYASAADFRNDLEAYLATLDERPTIRDISLVVATLFDDQRKQRRQIIESCLASARNGTSSDAKLPSIAPPPDNTTPGQPQHRMLPFVAHDSPIHPPPPSTSMPAAVPHTPETVRLPAQETAPSRRGWLVALLVLLLVSGSVVATVLVIKSSERPHDRDAIAVTTAATSTSPSAQPTTTSASATTSADSTEAAHPSAAVSNVPRPRVIYVQSTQTSRPATPSADKPSASASKADCNPPFYFEGTKKVFKPGCL